MGVEKEKMDDNQDGGGGKMTHTAGEEIHQ